MERGNRFKRFEQVNKIPGEYQRDRKLCYGSIHGHHGQATRILQRQIFKRYKQKLEWDHCRY